MQNINLADNLERETKKSTKVLDGKGVKGKQKEFAVRYFLPDENKEKVEVCKTMYIETFGISDKRKKVVLEKKYSGTLCSIRYQHASTSRPAHNKFSEDIVNEINQFIKQFPSVPSHYRRKDSKKYYFEMGFNYKKMYKIYTENTGFVKHVSLQSFRNILGKFNVGFHKSIKDQCSACCKYENEEKTKETIEAHKQHLRRKDLSRIERSKDKKRAQEDKTFLALIVDMAQVAPCPKAEAAEFFLHI